MKTKQWRWSDVRRAVESVFIPGERKALLDAFQAAGERKQYKALAGLRQTEWRLAPLPIVTIEARLTVTRGALSEFTTLEVRANGEVGPPNGPWYDAIARQINRGLGIAPQQNPTKRPAAAKKTKAPALPRSVKFIVVEPETDLYRGSDNPDDWREERQWFTDSIDTAIGYMEGRDGPWAVVWFSTTRPLRLIHLANYKALDRLMRALGVTEYDGDPHDAAPAVCALGVDGWLIDEGAHGGTDTLICDAASFVEVVRGIEQSDDWDWRRWKGY